MNEQDFRVVADPVPVLIWMSDADRRCIYFNKSWQEFPGQSPESERGSGWADGVHPDDVQRCFDVYVQSFDRRDKFRNEYRRRRQDGEYRWILDTAGPRFDKDGSFLGYIGIGVDLTEHKRTEAALQDREKQLIEAQRLARVGSWQWEPRTDTVIWSQELYRLMGIDPNLPAPSYKEQIHLFTAESWERLQRAVQGALQTGTSYELEVEIARPESSVKWEIARGEPVRDKSGQIIGLRGTVQDITERKRAEEALLRIRRRLSVAQEQERTRIGRELHDDIGQSLATLIIRLQLLHEDAPDLPQVRRHLEGLQKLTSEIIADVQSLSHRLHSSHLEYLGIVAAMRSFCHDFGKQQKMEIDFNAHDVPNPLSPDISVCLFRALQEAVHNSAKHSGVRHNEVRLWGTSDGIHLTVKDSGAGFDRETAKEGCGLGLISMGERLRLVNGTLSIESQPKHGTTVHVRVPFHARDGAMAAAG